jgi:hypothetical protein
MNELRKAIKREAIDKVEKHVSSYKPFNAIIDIYVDMRIEQNELENQISELPKDSEKYTVLSEILDDLKANIQNYQEQLLIN